MNNLKYEELTKEMIDSKSFINIDETDIRSIYNIGGTTYKGIGYSDNKDIETRSVEALKNALENCDYDLKNAKGVLVNISCGAVVSEEEFEMLNKYLSKNISENITDEFFIQSIPSNENRVRVFVGLVGLEKVKELVASK